MKLELPLLFVVLFCGGIEAFLSKPEFVSNLKPKCFRTDERDYLVVNGQDHPLPLTLESFIALAEKLELENPGSSLQEELFHFIREYMYSDLEYSNAGDVLRISLREFNKDALDKLWEPNESTRREKSKLRDPFSDDEKCAVFYSISHSIFLKYHEKRERFLLFNDGNRSRSARPIYDVKKYFPNEIGVVSVRGSARAVALGKVLVGMYIGLQNNRISPLQDIKSIASDFLEYLPERNDVDRLYQLTIAEVISLATWAPEMFKRDWFAPDGIWDAPPSVEGLDTKDICSTMYLLPVGTNSTQSFSKIRGAADGLILGSIMRKIAEKRSDLKLSQILRQYYSKGGFSSIQGTNWASYCNRESWLQALHQDIKDQVLLFQFIVSEDYPGAKADSEFSIQAYTQVLKDALDLRNTDKNTYSYCTAEVSTDDQHIKDLPLESPLDVIVVLDTKHEINLFKTQQKITGYVAKQLDLQYFGSRMTVVLTEKERVENSAVNGQVHLKEIFNDTYNSGCAACSVVQFDIDEIEKTNILEDEVIIAIDQLLQRKKEAEAKANGVSGKVVVYFNFQEESKNGRPDPMQTKVNKALRDLHLRHRDATIVALGRTPEIVKKYARLDSNFVLSAVDVGEDIVAGHILEKIRKVPAVLQYEDCEQARSENSAIYETFVTRNAIQHWEMPAQYMYKSRGFKFTFEASTPIKVCYNRATMSPELQASKCQQGTKVEVRDANPCESFTKDTCSSLNFAVLGVNDTDNGVCIDNNLERKCSTIDQIKFKVSHDGIRCSGCIGLTAVPVLLVITTLLLRIFSKAH